MAVVGDHQQAPWWATPIAVVTAPLAALGPQLAPAGVTLARHWWYLLYQLVFPGTAPVALFMQACVGAR